MIPESRIRNRVAVLIVQDDKILLVQHEKYGKKYWLVPGGGIEYGETLAEAARRELKEECSLNVRIGDLLFVSETIPPDRHRHVINYYLEGEIVGGEMSVNPDAVLRDAQWHPIEDLPHLILFPPTAREILDWAQSKTIHNRSLGNRWK